LDIGRQVYWHQGLFLQPQHFQYIDQYNRSLALSSVQISESYPWGYYQLKINTDTLNSGIIEISRMDCLLRDGTFVSWPNNCELCPRNFDANWEDRTKPFMIYLGVHHASEKNPNVTVYHESTGKPNAMTRYVSSAEGQPLNDLYDGDKSTVLKQLSLNAAIYFEHEIEGLDDIELLPLARLRVEGNDVVLCQHYIPPLLSLKASPVIQGHLHSLKNNLLSRATILESSKSTAGVASTSGFNPATMKSRFALQVLSRYISQFLNYVEAPHSQAVEVYGTLRGLISELSIFSEKFSMTGESNETGLESLPAYHHDRLGEIFKVAMDIVGVLLNELTSGPELFVQLKKVEANKFSGALSQEFFNNRNSVYLLLHTEQNIKPYLESFLKFSKLGASGQVEIYARRSLPGVRVVHIEGRPLGVSVQPNTHYFMIEREGFEWGYVKDLGQIGLVWDGQPEDMTVDIVAVRG